MTKTKEYDMPTKTKPTTNATITQLANRAHALAEHSRTLAREAEDLEAQVKLARGTALDVSKEAAAAGAKPARPDGSYSVSRARRNVVVPNGEPATHELYETIKQLITDQPRRFRDIVEATHAGENRIKGVLVRLQRDGAGVVNLGDGARALWFIPDDEVLARLKSMKRARR